jgi:peptidoglycan/xylan/chitin deacetylase (PgdA/CDA1 family)
VLREYGITAFWFVYTSPFEGKIERLELYRYYRTTQFVCIEDFYTSFFEALTESPEGDRAAQALRDFDPSLYLTEWRYYTDNDKRFRFLRDRVLGTIRYNRVMDVMISSSGLSEQQLAADLWMDENCLSELHSQGHVIGLHSHTHPTLMESLPTSTQKHEYDVNYRWIAEIVKEQPTTMSHPCNSYNSATLDIARELGIVLGFRADMIGPTLSSLEFPREDHSHLVELLRS